MMRLMDIEIIKKAGLTDSQAKAYLALIEQGTLTAQQLSELIAETRTNCYAVLDKLIANGLAQKVASTSKYAATLSRYQYNQQPVSSRTD